MSLPDRILRARRDGDFGPVIDSVPYFKLLGLRAEPAGESLRIIMPASPEHVGRPKPPFIHGGIIGALLEATALLQLLAENTTHVAKTISITTDYLRSARIDDTFAEALITRMGRRVASVRVEAWQEKREKPIAQAHGHFLLIT
jgi:uncharacterized protein (TIGR00369 family)